MRALSFLIHASACGLIALAWPSWAQGAAPPPAATVLRQGLTEHLLKDVPGAPIQESALPEADVRAIVRERLDAGLLMSVRLVSGRDFHFLPTGHRTDAQVALLVLTYPDEQTAEHRAKRLVGRKGYLRNTKIYTPFTHGRFRDQVVIVYTESAGNAAVLDFVKTFPERYLAACAP